MEFNMHHIHTIARHKAFGHPVKRANDRRLRLAPQ
jgi:hypothetical protein